jgi:ABC-type transporter Mla MlaB component
METTVNAPLVVEDSLSLKILSEEKVNRVEKVSTVGDNYFLVDSSVLNEQTLLKSRYGEVFQSRGEYSVNELAGVYFQGVQYFDLKNVFFINNTGIANLLDILKSLLQQGTDVKFVNVNETIKNKFKSMGLECIFNCS